MSTIFKDAVNFEVCGETITAGQALYKSLGTGSDSGRTAGRVYKLDVSNVDRRVYYGVAKTGSTVGNTIKVVSAGIAAGFTGLTAGTILYADGASAGGYVTTAPSSNIQVLGIAKSATSIVVNAALAGSFVSSTSSGGASIPDTFVQLLASEGVGAWSTGNNATFLGGGALAGTFAQETTTPLNGTESYKFTQAAGSLNDYIAAAVQAVPVRFRGNPASCIFAFKYDGAATDIEPVIWDVTNSAKLTSSLNLLPAVNSPTQLYKVNVAIPLTCTQVRVGFQVKVANTGKILQFDDVQISSDTTKYSASQITEAIELTTVSSSVFGSTNQTVHYFTPTKNTNKGILRVDSNSTDGTSFVALRACVLNMSVTTAIVAPTGNQVSAITRNSTNLTTGFNNNVNYYVNINSGYNMQISTSLELKVNDVIRIQRIQTTHAVDLNFVTLTATTQEDSIITASESFSSDTASFVFKATAIVDSDPIGTFNTYTYASSSNTATISGSAPTQTTSDMNVNGIRVFARAYNAASTTASPARVDVYIGKGLKGKQVDAYASAAKVTALAYDYTRENTTVSSGTLVTYNEITGVLIIEAAVNASSAVTERYVNSYSTSTAYYGSAYFVINASKSPALVGVPQVQPRIATLSDVKSSGTAGGTATSGSWQTRTLNTLVDSTGIVASLSANQFTLQAGTYSISGYAMYHQVDGCQVKIRNITDSTDSVIGNSTISLNTGNQSNACNVDGEIIITSTKTFELQGQIQTTFATSGFGRSVGFGVSEVYAQLKITRVK